MFQHHLLIVIRNLKRHKGSFLINLISLSTGLACALLIYLWVNDELHFDKFHQHDAQLYQVMEKSKVNDNVMMHESTQGPLAAAMAKDLPEVAQAATLMSLAKNNLSISLRSGNKAVKNSGIFATPNFFDLFSFKLLAGQPAQVLRNENGIVLSETLANQLFGSVSNAMGKPVEWELFGLKKQAIVTGVLDKLPANNSMQLDFILTYETLVNGIGTNFKQWYNEGPETYLLLQPGTDADKFNTKITHYLERYSPGTVFSLYARPYSSAYLYGTYQNGEQAGGRIEYVKLFSLVAIFILLIACINFMNLSTAKASRRLKEVGIKKTVGATRQALVVQFLSEAMFMTFLSLLFTVLLVALLLPVFNQVTGKQLSIHLTLPLVSWVLGATLCTGFLSGSYPAFYLSGFDPVAVLKGKLASHSFGELLARKGLVIFQFMISLLLIIAVMVIYRQVSYVQSKNLGYDKSNIIQFDKEGNLNTNYDAFLSELKRVPGVVSASAIQETVVSGVGGGSGTYAVDWPGKTAKQDMSFVTRAMDYGMLETLGVQMQQGRTFSRTFGAEDTKVIFNETAIKMMGLKNPVGTSIKLWGNPMSIVGVVKDFHVTSLHEAIPPMIFMYAPKKTAIIMVKMAPGKAQETIARIETFYKQFNPGYLFNYKFLDESYQSLYVAEQRVSLLSRYFAGLAILISCLGLFGLATFNAEIRTKEIGIRKVLGASVGNVIVLLSKDFVTLILIAIVIAFPLAWWVMNAWLNNFVYHIHLSADLFLIAAVAIVLISILTVSYQSIRAALMNPSKSLNTD